MIYVSMKIKQFEERKIKTVILLSGETFTFYRNDKNEFNEPLLQAREVAVLKGIYHTNTSYIGVTDGDSGSISNKVYTPSILCLVDDNSKAIKKGDYTFVGDKKIEVNDKINYLEKDFAFDISCKFVEVINDGK